MMQNAPTTSASAAANAAWSSGSLPALDPTATAVINDVVDSGPTDSCGDDPNTAYTKSGPTMAHSPTTAGSPATSAYAMTCGTRYAATVTPARTSPRSHDRS